MSQDEARAEPASPLFELKPEWQGPCERRETVDVNLGHSPEAFVRAAFGQLSGKEAPAELVAKWAGELRRNVRLRRIDVVLSLARELGRSCPLGYSDPWRAQPELLGLPHKRVKRDVGAVFMFFFDCPCGVNCGMSWANTHALGMLEAHPLLAFGEMAAGYYQPSQAGFWRRELSEASYAGLDFLLLNTYGPDVENGKLAPLAAALETVRHAPKLALFDDTWTWGKPYFSELWAQKPDLGDSEAAARLIYEAKWRPFFSQIERRHWYRFAGKPFIYFYNGGTLEPRERAAALIEKLKARFAADFGEQPFVAVDGAFFDDPRMPNVADSRFRWFTFDAPGQRSRSTLGGHVLDHAMVRWDAVGRERPGEVASETDLLVKDASLLRRVLNDSRDADVLVLATWNDLGEGTGLNRNYDYYVLGEWLRPDHFMRLIRDSQCGKEL